MMNLSVNGEEHEIGCSTLAELMAALDYEGSWLATAVNGELYTRPTAMDGACGTMIASKFSRR